MVCRAICIRSYVLVSPDVEYSVVGPGIYCSPRHPTHIDPLFLELNGSAPYDVASDIRLALLGGATAEVSDAADLGQG
jgi:hypothetical protein